MQEFPKNSQKIPKEILKNSPKIPYKFKDSQRICKNPQDFENIQFPTSHLEAENPFGLVFSSNHMSQAKFHKRFVPIMWESYYHS